jgi:hypothetical protein
VIVRSDLAPGIRAAQIVHAAGESSPGNLPEGTFAIALAAEPNELQDLAIRLSEAGIAHRNVRESDEPYSGELMAIGVFPQPRSKLRRYFSTLPLVR